MGEINDEILMKKIGFMINQEIRKEFVSYRSSIDTQLDWLESRIKELKDFIPELKEEMRHVTTETLLGDEFVSEMKKFFSRFITQEINSQISNHDLHGLATNLIITKTEDNFKEIITEVVNKVLTSMNQKLNLELEITKKLSYSIDKEIKHLSMRNGFSDEVDKIALNAIKKFETNGLKELEDKS